MNLIIYLYKNIPYLIITAVSWTIFNTLLNLEHINYTNSWKIILLSLTFLSWITLMMANYFRIKEFTLQNKFEKEKEE